MRAIVYEAYGPPSVLKLKEVDKPTPKDDEVLIKVHAYTVSTGDVNMRGFTFVPPGFGFLPRLMFGIHKPKKPILGTEVSGTIEAVGKDVSSFKVGDKVFGIDSNTLGAYAEYVCRPENSPLAPIPEKVSFEDAAAIAFGGGTALYFLRDIANIKAGQKVLVIGASGSVGSYTVQLAKYYGAEVTGICSTKNLALVQSFGADKVIDYTKDDFNRRKESFDIIVDTVPGQTSVAESKEVLKKNGLYLAIAGGLKEMLLMIGTGIFGSKKVKFGAPTENRENLIFLSKLVEMGKIKPYIDRQYSMEKTAEAHAYVDTGRKRGNIVITV